MINNRFKRANRVKIIFFINLLATFLYISISHAEVDHDALLQQWNNASFKDREKIIIDFFEYAFQPVAPNRQVTLERLKCIRDIMNSSDCEGSDALRGTVLKKIVDDEIELISAALYANIPEWCGTVPTNYLTGDNIALLCTHKTFRTNWYSSFFNAFDPKKVQAGDSVFVATHYLNLFFDVYHKEIEYPYVLVTHNSDAPAPGHYASFLDDKKILAWFCINPDETQCKKLHPMPIGIRNHGFIGEPVTYIDTILPFKGLPKKHLLYINFRLNHPDRHDAIHLFFNKSWCTTIFIKKNQTEYYQDIAQSKFVLSPHGVGLDCWRTWETLLMGSFPVVKHSPLDSLYEEFPMVIVNDWDEVTEEFLENKYNELLQKNYDHHKLFVSYWSNLINSFK